MNDNILFLFIVVMISSLFGVLFFGVYGLGAENLCRDAGGRLLLIGGDKVCLDLLSMAFCEDEGNIYKVVDFHPNYINFSDNYTEVK